MHLYRQTNASRACPEPSRKHAYKHAVLDIRARDNDVLTRCTILDHEKTKLGRQPGTNRSLHEPKTTNSDDVQGAPTSQSSMIGKHLKL